MPQQINLEEIPLMIGDFQRGIITAQINLTGRKLNDFTVTIDQDQPKPAELSGAHFIKFTDIIVQDGDAFFTGNYQYFDINNEPVGSVVSIGEQELKLGLTSLFARDKQFSFSSIS